MKKIESFTLVELLVVIVIIGVLAGVIMFSITSSIEKADVTRTRAFSESVKNNLLVNLVSSWDASDYTKNGTYWSLNDPWGFNSGSFVSNGGDCSDVSGFEVCPQIETDDSMDDILVFSGADGERIISYVSLVDFESEYGPTTLEVWFNKTELESAGYSTIFADNCMEWGIVVDDLSLQAWVYASHIVDSIDLNKWYHVVLVHDHSIDDPSTTSTIETDVRVYLNGEKKIDDTYNVVVGNGYIDFPLQIGDDNCRTDRELTGKVKQVRIYSAPLSESLIKQNYLSGLKELLGVGEMSKEEYEERLK